ncbi:hypothetical protein DITRI_Ditri19aG0117900 [Diplodiscus trichospermus]
MGNASSMLTQYDIEEVQEYCNNLFSQQEIVSLYKRFCQLDRNSKGFISADEFLSVPEFAMNPLSQRLLKMVDGLNFKDFVAFLSAFSAKASEDQKIQLIFKVYDSDGNGKVSFNDILEVFRDLSGSFISDGQREQVLTQLLEEAGYSRDSYLTLDDFTKNSKATQLQLTLHAAVANSLRRQAKRGNIVLKMLSMSLDISFSGLLKNMLDYFTGSVVSLLLELIGQGRAANMFEETQNLDSMQLVQQILPREMESRRRFSDYKNFKAAICSGSSSTSATTSNDSRSKTDALAEDYLFSKYRNGGASASKESLEKSGVIICNTRSKACSSLCKGKVVLQASEAEQLNTRLKILEEENEALKQAFLETVVEKKKLVNEICQLLQTLRHSLHRRDKKVDYHPAMDL